MVNLDLEMILETLLNAAKRRKREREHLEGSSEGKFRQQHININININGQLTEGEYKTLNDYLPIISIVFEM